MPEPPTALHQCSGPEELSIGFWVKGLGVYGSRGFGVRGVRFVFFKGPFRRLCGFRGLGSRV